MIYPSTFTIDPRFMPTTGDVLRCEVTKNPCGTDTWEVGVGCKCKNCQHYVEFMLDKEIECLSYDSERDLDRFLRELEA